MDSYVSNHQTLTDEGSENILPNGSFYLRATTSRFIIPNMEPRAARQKDVRAEEEFQTS